MNREGRLAMRYAEWLARKGERLFSLGEAVAIVQLEVLTLNSCWSG